MSLAAVAPGRVERPLDFVVIGAAKSGTTTLFHHLRHHPGLFLPADKERPFFSKDDVYLRGWGAYVDEVFGAAPADVRWGKVTPRYLGDLHVPARLAAAMPDTRLHAILRHPVQRAYSKYRLNLRQGIEHRPFAQVVDDQLQPGALERARTQTLPMGEALVVRGEYGRLLETFLAEFPREQLLVHVTDELESDPQRVIDEILVHIGLDPGWVPPNLGDRFYVGGDRQRLAWLPSLVRSVPPLRAAWERVPLDRRRRAQHLYSTQLSVGDNSAPPAFPAETRARLVEHYRNDVPVLEEILGHAVPWPDLRGGAST